MERDAHDPEFEIRREFEQLPQQNALQIVRQFIQGSGAKIVGFGEIHCCPNPFQRFGAILMPHLKALDFTHLAIESPINIVSELLEAFNQRTGDDENLAILLAHNHPKNFGRDRTPALCEPQATDYFNLLISARESGLLLCAVDAPHPIVTVPRDRHIAERIFDLSIRKDTGRVAFWGGCSHVHVRDISDIGIFRSSFEQLRYGSTSGPVITICGVIPDNETRCSSDYHMLVRTALQDLKVPLAVAPDSIPRLAEQTAFRKTCCPNGEGREQEDLDSETFQIRYKDWDLILLCP